MGQFEFIAWLYYWLIQAQNVEFEWDAGNLSKSAVKHGVLPDEVESVFYIGMAIPIGRQISPQVREERRCIVGPSTEGRIVSIVFTIREGRVRAISTRVANQKEKRLYENLRKET